MQPSKGGITKSTSNGNVSASKSTGSNTVFCPMANEKDFQRNYELILKVFGEIFDVLAKKRISIKQLEYLFQVEENTGLLYSQLIHKLSAEHQIPRSTVRWNLKRLRDAGMMIAGDKNTKRVPVRLTERGRIALLAIKAGRRNLSKNFCSKSLSNGELYLEEPVHSLNGKKHKGESLGNKKPKSRYFDEAEEKFELSFWYETRPEGP